MPVYNGRIFLPYGVYSQRTQSVLDVIVLVSSVQYAQDPTEHVSMHICVGKEVSSQRRGKRCEKEHGLCSVDSVLYDVPCIGDDKVCRSS